MAFCILLCFHAFCVVKAFCILLLYRARFSGFLYAVSCHVFKLFVFDHDGPSSSYSQLRNWTVFSSQIFINSILVCTILWVSCYVFMPFVFDHDGSSLSSYSQLCNWTVFSSRILINSILACTILWVEHNGHRRVQILFPSHPSSHVRDLDFLGYILCLESMATAEAFVTSTLAFMYPSLLYAPRFTILLNPPLCLSSLR